MRSQLLKRRMGLGRVLQSGDRVVLRTTALVMLLRSKRCAALALSLLRALMLPDGTGREEKVHDIAQPQEPSLKHATKLRWDNSRGVRTSSNSLRVSATTLRTQGDPGP